MNRALEFRRACAGRRPGRALPILVALLLLMLPPALAAQPRPQIALSPRPMPDFLHATPEAWLNSPPLRAQDLRGQVLLVEIWTSV
jgi:hypothetical protein